MRVFDHFGTLCIKCLKGESASWHFSQKMPVQVSQLTELCKGKNKKNPFICVCIMSCYVRTAYTWNSFFLIRVWYFLIKAKVFYKENKIRLNFSCYLPYHAKSTLNLLRSLRILRSFLKRYDSEWFLASGLGTNGLIFQMNCYF